MTPSNRFFSYWRKETAAAGVSELSVSVEMDCSFQTLPIPSVYKLQHLSGLVLSNNVGNKFFEHFLSGRFVSLDKLGQISLWLWHFNLQQRQLQWRRYLCLSWRQNEPVGHRAWLGTFSNLGYYIPSRHEKAVKNEKKDILRRNNELRGKYMYFFLSNRTIQAPFLSPFVFETFMKLDLEM